MEYTIRSLGSFSEMKYGKMPNKKMISEDGKYPIFSGYRVVGYCNECNIEDQQLIVVARGVGGTGDVKLSPGACYLTNLSIAVFNRLVDCFSEFCTMSDERLVLMLSIETPPS